MRLLCVFCPLRDTVSSTVFRRGCYSLPLSTKVEFTTRFLYLMFNYINCGRRGRNSRAGKFSEIVARVADGFQVIIVFCRSRGSLWDEEPQPGTLYKGFVSLVADLLRDLQYINI